MERRSNRTVWIVVIVGLIAVCLCAAGLVAAAFGWLTDWSFDWSYSWPGRDGGADSDRQVIERTFEAGDDPVLDITSFAGDITILAGSGDTMKVVATKRAFTRSNLDRIEVNMSEQGDRVVIETRKTRSLARAWVELEIIAPAGTDLDLSVGSGDITVRDFRSDITASTGSGGVTIANVSGAVSAQTGSGGIDVYGVAGDVQARTGSGGIHMRDVKGDIEANTGSGSIEVSSATGAAALETGSGGIEYQGTPEGDCVFKTSSGSIRLTLPSDLNMEVDLHTGSGGIDIEFAVDGQISRQDVKGVIGSGGEGKIYARTGSGSIDLTRR